MNKLESIYRHITANSPKNRLKRSENMHYSIVNIIMFFLIYGFLGFLAESIFRSIAEKRLFISRAFLTNGFCPLYGLCGILIVIIFTLCELTINNTLWALILATVASIITVTFLEYIVG